MKQKQVFISYDLQPGQESRQYSYCPYCGCQLELQSIGSNKRMTCLNCGFIHFKNPLPTVSIIARNGTNILLGQRLGEPGQGKWALPSGYIDFNEDFLSAAIREMKEETGLDIEITEILNVVSSFVSPRFHFIGIYVAAKVVGGELAAGDDLVAVKWFSITGPLPEMGFEEDVRIIKAIVSGFAGLPVDSNYVRVEDID